MTGLFSEPERRILIEATPETVFAYLADLVRHGEWDGHPEFRVVRTSEGLVGKGSNCDRERLETFQAPILRGAAASSQVSWIKSLTVIDFKTDARLEFETKNLYNGLSVGSETVLFRLAPEGSGALLVMTGKRSAHVPGPLHVLMMFLDSLKSVVSRPIISWMFQLFPRLRTNGQLSRIKRALENTES